MRQKLQTSFQSWKRRPRFFKFVVPFLYIKRHQKNTPAKVLEKIALWQHDLMSNLLDVRGHLIKIGDSKGVWLILFGQFGLVALVWSLWSGQLGLVAWVKYSVGLVLDRLVWSIWFGWFGLVWSVWLMMRMRVSRNKKLPPSSRASLVHHCDFLTLSSRLAQCALALHCTALYTALHFTQDIFNNLSLYCT